MPDGLVVVVKEECESCRMVAPLLGALPGVTVYTQDDPAFPAGVDATHDADLAVSWHHDHRDGADPAARRRRRRGRAHRRLVARRLAADHRASPTSVPTCP